MNNEYINKGFRILHLTKQPHEIMEIYTNFMWDYHNKHKKSFSISMQISMYNQKQAETFYRFTRLYYQPRYLEDKLFVP